jgi:hypothetical protein
MRASGVLLFGSVSLCCRCLGCAPGLLRRARALPLPLPLPLSVLPLVSFAPFWLPLASRSAAHERPFRPENRRRRWFGSILKQCGLCRAQRRGLHAIVAKRRSSASFTPSSRRCRAAHRRGQRGRRRRGKFL